MTKFVIITPGRSGSTFLAKSLNLNEEVHCEEEIFNRSVHYKGSFNEFISSKLQYRLVAFFFNREKLSTSAFNFPLHWVIIRFLREKESKNYGFKISLDQLFAYPQLLKILSDFKVIYLTRADKQRMVLSLLAARQSGNYDVFSGEKVNLDPELVKKHLEQMIFWEQQCLDRLNDSLRLLAEELFENQTQVLSEIQNHLGLNDQINPIKSSKTHPDAISDWVENYDEIKQYLNR